MRRSASEILRNLENRIARLEGKTASVFRYQGDHNYSISKRDFERMLGNYKGLNVTRKPVLLELFEGADIGLGLFNVNNGEDYLIASIVADSLDDDTQKHEWVDSSEDSDEAITLFYYHARTNWKGSVKTRNIKQ